MFLKSYLGVCYNYEEIDNLDETIDQFITRKSLKTAKFTLRTKSMRFFGKILENENESSDSDFDVQLESTRLDTHSKHTLKPA